MYTSTRLIMTLMLLCFNILTCDSETRPTTELFDAFMRFVQFGPALYGFNFTEQDEKSYAAGAKFREVQLGIEEIITRHGYSVERHEVRSADGYLLRVFRMRSGGGGRSGQPVLLMHGLMLSADDWVTAGPDSGLAYQLAAEGFDVWMGNARGTKHSCAHVSRPPHSAAFWDFSWDEIGRYDLPAMIDLVLHVTAYPQLLYVGHSQGTTAFFVMASEMPNYNHKISLMVALAPAAAIDNLKSPFIQFIKYATLLHPDLLFTVLRKYGANELVDTNALTEAFALVACAESRIARAICASLVFLMCGFNYAQLNFTSLPAVLSHLKSSRVAFKQIEHYAQTVTSQKFARFDYGAERNEYLYGSRDPPEYNVSAITTPVAILYSAEDWLASELDTQILRKKLTNVVGFYKVPDEHFNHLDFVYAKDLRELVFKPMLKYIQKSLV